MKLMRVILLSMAYCYACLRPHLHNAAVDSEEGDLARAAAAVVAAPFAVAFLLPRAASYAAFAVRGVVSRLIASGTLTENQKRAA